MFNILMLTLMNVFADMFVCVCVCVYVCVYVCVGVCVRERERERESTQVCIELFLLVHTHPCGNTHVHDILTHTFTQLCTYMFMLAYLSTNAHVSIHMRAHTHTHTDLHVCTHTHTHTHTHTYTYTLKNSHTCWHTNKNACTHTCKHSCAHTHTHTHTHTHITHHTLVTHSYICSVCPPEQVAHPPGYPLYTLMLKTFFVLVPYGTVAWRANLLTSILAAAAGSFLYQAVFL